jgi:glycosyltransferase involved in cell wall biosynthesis
VKFAFVSFNEWASWGGSEELWSRAAHALLHDRHTLLACVAPWRPAPLQLEQLGAAGCSIHRAGLRPRSLSQKIGHVLRGRPPAAPLPETTVQDIIVPFRPDLVVISQGNNQDGLRWAEACQQQRLPYVLIAQAAIPYLWPVNLTFERLRAIYNNARAIFFVSRHNRELTEQQLAMDLPQAVIISNPFLVPFDQPPTWPSDNEFRLAQVARMEPGSKGQDVLLEVLSQIKWRGRPLRVSLYGRGNCDESVRALVTKMRLSNVDMKGHVNDVGSIWQKHHGLILPSRYEGTPLALIEAMLCHRFAIVTDVGGNSELVVDGRHGYIAESATVAALDRAMEHAWQQRAAWRELGLEAGRHIRTIVSRDPATEFAGRLINLAQS